MAICAMIDLRPTMAKSHSTRHKEQRSAPRRAPGTICNLFDSLSRISMQYVERGGPVFLVLGVAASLLVGPTIVTADESVRVSVCEVLRAPERYLGKEVEVTGQTEGHWFEGALLRDRSCPDAGAVGLAGETSSGIDELRRASAAADRAGNTLPGVATVLRGRFEQRADGFPRYILVVTKVVSIKKGGVPSAVPPIPPKRP
jgi:hypothetical protein